MSTGQRAWPPRVAAKAHISPSQSPDVCRLSHVATIRACMRAPTIWLVAVVIAGVALTPAPYAPSVARGRCAVAQFLGNKGTLAEARRSLFLGSQAWLVSARGNVRVWISLAIGTLSRSAALPFSLLLSRRGRQVHQEHHGRVGRPSIDRMVRRHHKDMHDVARQLDRYGPR